jgi:hypothetical protein
MKSLVFTLTVLCSAMMVDAQEMGRRPIVDLPFSPGEAKIIDRQQRGRIEIITYEYKGKNYQEERVYTEPRHIPAKTLHAMAELKKIGLTDEQAFEVSSILHRTNWQRYRHLQEKWPASAVETIRRQIATELKSGIAHAIGSSEPSVLELILTLDLGYERVPLKDFIVRKNARDEPTP